MKLGPGAGWEWGGGKDIKVRSLVEESQMVLAAASRTDVTKACFCIASEGRPLGGGSSRVPARSGRGGRVPAWEGAVRCKLRGVV